MEVLHHVRARRRIRVTRAGAALVAALALVLCAGCRDVPDRAGQIADTAVLQDQRIAAGGVGRDTLGQADSTDTTAADTLDAPRGMIVVLAADSTEGFFLYHRKAGCIACHGPDGAGLANLGPSLRDSVWLHIDGTPGEIAEVIRTGIARPREAGIAMPGLASRLEPGEIEQVAAFVYSLSHPGAAVADTAAARRHSVLPPSDTIPGPT